MTRDRSDAPPRTGALNAAGFVTAFGAHSIAAGLGVETESIGMSLLTLGLLLAVYDVAEVILKPLFGVLSDRIGVKPVIIGGLLAFSGMSVLGVFASTPLLLALVRFGQGGAAAAFSPAASAGVARMAGPNAAGRYFGKYGSWKGLGYALGPLIGAGLIWAGGFPALFVTLAVSAALTAVWVAGSVPALPVLAKVRYTVVDLFRQLADRSFLVPVAGLAAATGTLGTAVGFLPLMGAQLELPTVVSVGVVTVLAVSSALVQLWVGRLRDAGRISTRSGIAVGAALIVSGLAAVAIEPSIVSLYASSLALGLGIGTITTLGFAHLASTTPGERMGRTMGTAEMGRELGDAGGPLIVGAVATAVSLSLGLWVLAALVAIVGVVSAVLLRSR